MRKTYPAHIIIFLRDDKGWDKSTHIDHWKKSIAIYLERTLHDNDQLSLLRYDC